MTDSIELESGSDTLRVYEVGYLLLSSIPEEKVPDEVSRIKSFIAKHKGTMIAEISPALRPLAYEMEKHIATRNERFESAYFGSMTFEVTPTVAVLLKTELDAMESVLRFILIKSAREAVVAPKVAEAVVAEDAGIHESKGETEVTAEAKIDKEIEELVV